MNSKFQKLVDNNFLFRLYLLKSLPMAYMAGVRVKELTQEKCVTTIKFKWITQNPFRSMYFACEAMAAEMSTALLLLNGIYKSSPPLSMLIVEHSVKFHKKAIGTISFECVDRKMISNKIEEAKKTFESVIITTNTIGRNEQNEIVAEFIFVWSIKTKVK